MSDKVKKYVGIGAIVGGAGLCYWAGVSESTVTGIVGGTFAFIAILAVALK